MDREQFELLFQMRSLDDGFFRIVDIVLVKYGLDSELADMGETSGEIFGGDNEAGWVGAIFV